MAEQMPNFPPPIRDVPPPTAQSEVERAIATHKSYVAPAAMVLFLYTLGYIPGLAFNIIFLSEAREVKRLSGRTPFGIELLYGLLIFGLLWFAGVLGIAMIVFGVGKSTMFALANWDPPRPTNARVVLVPTKKRPVVIVSLNNKIGQTSTVVPLTSKPDEVPSEHRVSIKNPNPNGGPEVWAIPSQVTTVSHWRLSRYWVSKFNCRVTPRVCEADFEAIVAELWRNLPMPR